MSDRTEQGRALPVQAACTFDPKFWRLVAERGRAISPAIFLAALDRIAALEGALRDVRENVAYESSLREGYQDFSIVLAMIDAVLTPQPAKEDA